MNTFVAVSSDWFMQYAGSKIGRAEDGYIAEMDTDFPEITLSRSSLPTACLIEGNNSGEMDERKQSPALFSMWIMKQLLCCCV